MENVKKYQKLIVNIIREKHYIFFKAILMVKLYISYN